MPTVAQATGNITRCATPTPDEATIQFVQRNLENYEALRKYPTVYGTTPIYFHVITTTSGEGFVPDSMLTQQVQILNDSYAGAIGGATTQFKFQLSGITRTTNDAWFRASYGSTQEREMKSALRIDDPKVLNLYIRLPFFFSEDVLGYASFPWDYSYDPILDGVDVNYRTLPGGSYFDYNEGDTTTHEVGHWLGLFHTFQGGCSDDNDQVIDTPAQNSGNNRYYCSVADTCSSPGLDPIHNFMGYTPDACMYEFTSGQGARMKSLAEMYRPNQQRVCRTPRCTKG